MTEPASIVAFERIAAAHWRGTEEEWLGDWLLRAAEGFTGRANSALPLGDPGLPPDEALDAVTRWYRDRELRPMIVIPTPTEPADPSTGPPVASQPTTGQPATGQSATGQSTTGRPATGQSATGQSATGQSTTGRPATDQSITGQPATGPFGMLDRQLTERGWQTRQGPAYVMVADLPLGTPAAALPPGREVRASAEPDDAWAARYHYRGQDYLPPVARKVLTSAPEQSFLSIRHGETVLAIARLSLALGWAGITAVEVNQHHRRQGLGAAITAIACEQALPHGLSQAFLQVDVGNTAARALYERLGFRYSHRYHYRIAPE